MNISLTLSSGDPFDADPPEDEHGAVVVDVKKADLVELLPQDEKDRVQKLHSFGDIVPPESRCYLKTGNIVCDGSIRQVFRSVEITILSLSISSPKALQR